MKIFGRNIPLGIKKGGKPQFHFHAFSFEEIACIGTIFCFAFFIAIAVWDGYIFYISVQKTPPPVIGENPSRIVTAKQIQDAINILDDREKKFNELLGN